MFQTKRVAGAFGVLAGVALFAFTGPAAAADESAPAPAPNPCDTVDPDSPVSTVAAVQTEKPENPGSNGNGSDKGDKDRDRTRDQDCEQTQDKDQKRDRVKDQTKDQTRAELREQIRLSGGSWGAYQRQGSLIKVATKLAERYGATPENTNANSLGRVLTLVNTGLPEALQIDVELFLAQYELSLSDITWPGADDPAPEPTSSPDVEPSVSPTA